MPSTDSQQISVSCPGCGAQYNFPASMAGRSGTCVSCGAEFAVPRIAAAATSGVRSLAELFDEDADQNRTPQYIAVECRVCQTRMYGLPHQVGRKLKCPDCGALTAVPPPARPKLKNIPAALEGEQYELWDADEQPLPSAIAAAQPKYIAVKCRQCDTLMYATEKQVGQTISCPDCGTKHKVPLPAKPKPKPAVLTADAETPQLDPAADPGERPPVIIPPRRRMEFEEQWENEYARALAESRRTGKPMRIDARGRPIMPQQPLVTGVWRMLVSEEVIARWILLSIVLGFAAQFLGEALLTPIQGQAEAIKLIFTVFGGILALLWLAMAAPLMVAIVGASADGEDKLHQPPRLLAFDWFGELWSVVMAGSAAGLCGLGASQLARLTRLGPVLSPVIEAIVVVTVLPVALLSALLEGTPFGVLSSRLVRSWRRCAGAWLLFYVQTFALAGLVGGAGWMLWQTVQPQHGEQTRLVWLLGPLAIAAIIVDMRLLGRLAWWISERMAAEENEVRT